MLLVPLCVLTTTITQQPRVPLGEVHRAIPVDGLPTKAEAFGDFNEDGIVDLLLGHSDSTLFHVGQGTGSFEEASFPDLGADVNAIVAVDVDDDGHLDAFLASEDVNRLVLGGGDGSFQDASANLPTQAAPSRTADAGDVDLDGDLDLIVGRFGDRVVQLENDGSGRFGDAAARMPAGAHSLRDALLADFDLDGAADYAGATSAFPTLETNVFFENNGAGSFSDASSRLGPDADDSRVIFADDFNRDGFPDLLFGVFASPVTGAPDRLLLGDGQGSFIDAPQLLPPTTTFNSIVASADLDLDGDPDIVLNTRQIYLNDGSGDLNTLASGSLGGVSFPSLVDLDGDGDPDAVSPSQGTDEVYLNDGSPDFTQIVGALEETFPPPLSFGSASRAAAGDIDGDGDLDIVMSVVIDFAGDSLQLHENDGRGRFVYADSAVPDVFNDGYAVTLTDIDSDADLDILHGNAHGNDVFLNDGTGTYSATFGLLPINGFVYDFVAADFDGDGDVDVFGSQGIGAFLPNRLYDNDGTGTFTDVSERILSNPSQQSLEAEALDFDLDGDLDLFVGNWLASEVDQLLQNEDGIFSDASALLPAPALPTNSVAVGDVNSDGAPDLVLGTGMDAVSGLGMPEALWLNAGSSFVDASQNLPAVPTVCRALRLGDLDGDGNLDLFAGDSFSTFRSNANRLFLGDGTGKFLLSSWRSTPLRTFESTADALLADLDGDRDLDLFLADEFDPRIYQGLGRHTASRALANLGKRFDLELFGTPASPWVLLATRQTDNVPLDIGTVFVDPSTRILPPAFGTLDGAGQAVYSLTIPAQAGLIGLEVFFQSALGSPLGLTNLESITVGAF